MGDAEAGLLIGWVLLAVGGGAVGALIGSNRDLAGQGGALGAVFGPLGWIVVLLMRPGARWEAQRQWEVESLVAERRAGAEAHQRERAARETMLGGFERARPGEPVGIKRDGDDDGDAAAFAEFARRRKAARDSEG